MNPVGEQTREQARRTAFQKTLSSARQTMMLSEILKIAGDSFRASKTRFALTALGMVIGTASVILVVTIGLTASNTLSTYYRRSAPTRWRWNTRVAAPLRRSARVIPIT